MTLNETLSRIEEIADYLNGTREACDETGEDFTAPAIRTAIKRLQELLVNSTIEQGEA